MWVGLWTQVAAGIILNTGQQVIDPLMDTWENIRWCSRDENAERSVPQTILGCVYLLCCLILFWFSLTDVNFHLLTAIPLESAISGTADMG